MLGQTVRNGPGRAVLTLERPESHRDDSLTERFYQLLALPTHRLEASLRPIIQAEHELPDAARYPAALARLRAWLDLDPEDARIIARAWDASLATFPSEYAARAIEAERAVICNGLAYAEFRRLAGILPWLRGERGFDLLAGEPAGDAAPAAA